MDSCGLLCAALVLLAILLIVCSACGGSRSGFRPVPVSTCRGGPCDGPCSGGCGGANGCRVWYDDQYAVDMGRGNGAALWDPYYGWSRIRSQCCPDSGRRHAVGVDGGPREGFCASAILVPNVPSTDLSAGLNSGLGGGSEYEKYKPGCKPLCREEKKSPIPANCSGIKATTPFACGQCCLRNGKLGVPCAECEARPGDRLQDIFNPVTGVGQHTDVRRSAERYCRGASLQRVNDWTLSSWEPGAMNLLPNDAALSADLARRDAKHPGMPPACGIKIVDPDADFLTDGLFGAAILNGTTLTQGCGAPSCLTIPGAPATTGPIDVADGMIEVTSHENFTSTRKACANDLTASRVGLGSTRMDPRFQPGSAVLPGMLPGPDGTNLAPGTHAGGPTLGALTPAQFFPIAGWQSTYVFGFGDLPFDSCSGQKTGPPEAITTGVSRF